MLLVDTNILVYASDADSPFHAGCRGWLEHQRRRADAWITTWSILYEFLRVTTHPRVMRQPWNVTEAWSFVQAMLASPGLGILAKVRRLRFPKNFGLRRLSYCRVHMRFHQLDPGCECLPPPSYDCES